MIFLLFLLTNADPLRVFHRIAQPLMNFEDEAKFLLISKRYHNLSQRILLNDFSTKNRKTMLVRGADGENRFLTKWLGSITIFKFEDQLKFPTELSLQLCPSIQQFLEEKILQNSERLKNVEFAYDEQRMEWAWRWSSRVAMLDKKTNELVGLTVGYDTYRIFERKSKSFRFLPAQSYIHSTAYHEHSPNLLVLLMKSIYPPEFFPVAFYILEKRAVKGSFHKIFLSLISVSSTLPPFDQLPNMNGVTFFKYAVEGGFERAVSCILENSNPDLHSLFDNGGRNILWRAGAHVGVLEKLMEKLDKEKPNYMAGLRFDSEFLEFIAENFSQPTNRLRYLYKMPIYECIRGMNNAFDTRGLIAEKMIKWETESVSSLIETEDMTERIVKRTANCVVVGILFITFIANLLSCLFPGKGNVFNTYFIFQTSLLKVWSMLQLQ